MKKYKRSRRVAYIKKQRKIGLLIAAFSILIGLLIDACVGLVGIMLGVFMMFTKELVWMDNYYWEQQSKKEEL